MLRIHSLDVYISILKILRSPGWGEGKKNYVLNQYSQTIQHKIFLGNLLKSCGVVFCGLQFGTH